MFENRTKKILKRALRGKEDNFILLNLDRYHQGKVIERLESQDKEGEKEYQKLIIQIHNKKNELDKERLKGSKNKEKMVILEGDIMEFENKIKTIKEKHRKFNEMKEDYKNYTVIIIEAKYLIETIKECINNSSKIYSNK